MSGSGERRPAWAKDSVVLRLDSATAGVDLSPEWAFAGSTGEGVRVAVVDSGIEADHPALEGCVDTEGSIEFTVGPDGEVHATPGPHEDAFGHGTACAGIIHALAPGARITSVRVLGPGLTGKAAAFHAGLSWAVDEGFEVINLSLGAGKAEWAMAFHEVCDRAYFSNSFVVTAANNIARVSYPSLFASVASVACNTTTDPLRFHVNPEPPTEFLARGIDVEVPWLGGGTTVTTGNSFAAPHIAGLATLIRAKHPELRPFQVKAALWATAANVREAGTADVAGRRGTVFVPSARSTAVVRSSAARSPGARSTTSPAGAAATTGPGRTGPSGEDGALEAFEVGEELWRSRWGPVHAAIRRADSSAVVVHDLRPALDVSPQARPALERSLIAVTGVRAPHLVEVLEVLTDPGPVVVAAPTLPLPGTDVAWSLERAGAAALAVAAALDTTHRAGLLHGDLSLRSVGLDADGAVRVGGAGVAGVLGASAMPGGRAMKPADLGHVAPELLEGREAGPAADVFGLAALTYRLLAAEKPYPDVDGLGAFLRQRLQADPVSLAERRRDLPGAVVDVVDRGLRRRPEERGPSVAEWARALAAALEEAPGRDAVAATGLCDGEVLAAWFERPASGGRDSLGRAPRRRW